MKRICDMRGSQFEANFIEINAGRPYYAGYLVFDLKQTETHRSKHFYSIIGRGGVEMGMIALSDGDKDRVITMIKPPKYIAGEEAFYDDEKELYYCYVGVNDKQKSLRYLAYGNTPSTAIQRAETLAKQLNNN